MMSVIWSARNTNLMQEMLMSNKVKVQPVIFVLVNGLPQDVLHVDGAVVLASPAGGRAYSHWLHLFDFSPVCVFKCLPKSPACEDAKSHVLQLFDLMTLSVFLFMIFKFVSSKPMS